MRLATLAVPLLATTLLSCSSADKVPPVRTYQIGERVNLGELAYTVSQKEWQNQLGSGVDARIPQNRFLLLRMNIENTGKSEAFVPNTQLQDEAGTSYPEVMDGEGVPDWIGGTRQLKPGGSVQGYLLYDVPPKRYSLQISGEEEKAIALVEIPLSFDSDVPDVTTPINPEAIPKKK